MEAMESGSESEWEGEGENEEEAEVEEYPEPLTPPPEPEGEAGVAQQVAAIPVLTNVAKAATTAAISTAISGSCLLYQYRINPGQIERAHFHAQDPPPIPQDLRVAQDYTNHPWYEPLHGIFLQVFESYRQTRDTNEIKLRQELTSKVSEVNRLQTQLDKVKEEKLKMARDHNRGIRNVLDNSKVLEEKVDSLTWENNSLYNQIYYKFGYHAVVPAAAAPPNGLVPPPAHQNNFQFNHVFYQQVNQDGNDTEEDDENE